MHPGGIGHVQNNISLISSNTKKEILSFSRLKYFFVIHSMQENKKKIAYKSDFQQIFSVLMREEIFL